MRELRYEENDRGFGLIILIPSGRKILGGYRSRRVLTQRSHRPCSYVRQTSIFVESFKNVE